MCRKSEIPRKKKKEEYRSVFGKTFFDWFGDVFCFSTETEGEGEDSRFFFATSVLAQQEGNFLSIDSGHAAHARDGGEAASVSGSPGIRKKIAV